MKQECLKNIIIISAIFCVSQIIFHLTGLQGEVNKLELIGSILAAAYVLTTRNPFNYVSFIMGAISSIILTIALWDHYINEAISYLVVFLPAQIYSFFVWRKMAQKEKEGKRLANPRWQTTKERIITLASLSAIALINILVMQRFHPELSLATLVYNGIFFSTSIIASVLLVYKLTDSRIYWVIFSISGILISLFHGTLNPPQFVLFMIFLIINTIALVEWVKMTK